MARDEAERTCGDRVAAPRDDDPAEARERGLTPGPVGVREQRVARATRSVGGDGAIVECGSLLGRGERARVSARERVEEPAVRLLRPMGEGACERVDENQCPAFADRERVTPQAESEPECGRR